MPPPKPTWTFGKIILVLVVALLVVCGGITAVFFAVLSNSSPAGSYAGQLRVDSYHAEGTYQGQVPTHTYWLIVNVTFENSGTLAIRFDRTDWELANIDGFFIAYPTDQFYFGGTATPGQSHRLSLVFDVFSFSEPAKVILTLPDGNDLVALL